ncbi:hypothetical protein [Bacillus sp. OK048]|uniref:hypothetical protein n=1 Tax=Bacillus sp. OK048 TaxID=1882761 RepID=UPI00088984C9|nr:hypothetical protein [Bacillus sp. OK048]SDN95914.1 hypothetical protein SAMN05443253_1325 [Bacillus sp. OK048]
MKLLTIENAIWKLQDLLKENGVKKSTDELRKILLDFYDSRNGKPGQGRARKFSETELKYILHDLITQFYLQEINK